MFAGVFLLFRYRVTGCIFLILLAFTNSMAAPAPTINITGNDNIFVWGTVQNLEHPLHYTILVYLKSSDGRWYGPITPGNDIFTDITPDLKWKCNYNPHYNRESDTAFKAYIIEKGVTYDEVMYKGAHNLSLFHARVIAQGEGEKKGIPDYGETIGLNNSTI